MSSKLYTNKELTDELIKRHIFVPPSVILNKLINEQKARIERGRYRVLSSTIYRLDIKDVLECAEKIRKEAYICESNPDPNSSKFPNLENVFNELVYMSKEEILLVSPFVSIEFTADLRKIFDNKIDILSVITNSPASSIITEKVYQSKVIKTLKDWDIDVKLSKKSFHAKIYSFDKKSTIIGSSNLSWNGFFHNYELETIIFGEKCKEIRQWIENLSF